MDDILKKRQSSGHCWQKKVSHKRVIKKVVFHTKPSAGIKL